MSKLPTYLTKIEGAPDSSEAIPGMAYFAGTGPYNTTCGHCVHRGYYRVSKIEQYDERTKGYISKSYKHAGCAMFTSLTGKYGPAIDANNKSCKYFEKKT